MAAGFTIKTADLDLLKKLVLEHSSAIPENLLVPTLTIDMEIPLNLVTCDFIEKVSSLEPYGVGNKEPLFVSRNVGIAGANLVGKEGQHTSLKLFSSGNYFKAILFNSTQSFNIGDKVDIVYSVSINEFNGTKNPNIVIKDFKIL